MAVSFRLCPSSSVRTPQRTHVINHRSSSSVSIRTAKVGLSTLHEESKKAYNHAEPTNKRLNLPKGWRTRRMELGEHDRAPSREDLRPTQAKPLSYEEYKQKYLVTYEQYEREHRHKYAEEKICKAYELYCKSDYKGYLLELAQENPRIIL